MKELLRTMWRIRLFEEKVWELVQRGEIQGTTHLCIGQEAVAAGAVSALQEGDQVMSTHRNHGHVIAKTGDLRGAMCEMMGRADGFSRGVGGSMHMADKEAGLLGTNGIVGAGIAISAGAAMAMKDSGNIVMDFFGDGATNTGVFHETMNIAALMGLPIVFVCENNGYGISTRTAEASAEPSMAKKAAAHCIWAETVDGNDVLAVRQVCQEAAELARQEQRPAFVEAMTYRWMGHSKSDKLVYRTRQEEAEWMARCPIAAFEKVLLEKGFSEKELYHIKTDGQEEVSQAVDYARGCPRLTIGQAAALVY